jgi:hypothetical protein
MFTPYAAAKVVNASLLEALPSAKPIPPQMMYNYTVARVNAGKAPFIKWDEVNGVDREDLERWTAQYVAKRVAKEGKPVADPEQYAFDLAEAN